MSFTLPICANCGGRQLNIPKARYNGAQRLARALKVMCHTRGGDVRKPLAGSCEDWTAELTPEQLEQRRRERNDQ